ncbi:MAG: hypothetical protein J5602_01960 [Clostridia bacterium]|nr:hypothetical protein [Clostridia bacterium]
MITTAKAAPRMMNWFFCRCFRRLLWLVFIPDMGFAARFVPAAGFWVLLPLADAPLTLGFPAGFAVGLALRTGLCPLLLFSMDASISIHSLVNLVAVMNDVRQNAQIPFRFAHISASPLP